MTPDADNLAPISVTTAPTFGDYLQFNLRFVFRSPAILFVGLFPLALALCYPLMPGIRVRADNVAYLLPALLVPTFFFVILPLSVYRAAKRRWRDSSELREERTYVFSDGGIQVTGKTFASFVAWSHIVSARRIGKLAILSTGQQAFHLIPVNAFGTDEDWERFCQLVETKVKGAGLT